VVVVLGLDVPLLVECLHCSSQKPHPLRNAVCIDGCGVLATLCNLRRAASVDYPLDWCACNAAASVATWKSIELHVPSCALQHFCVCRFWLAGCLAAWLPVCPPARLIIIAVAVQVTCSSPSPFPFASCTHITVGGVVGFALVYGGGDAVIWAGRTSSFPYLTGVVVIVASWFISPLLAGMSATQCIAYLRSIYTVAA
jgi:Phosphate transporter family